MQRIKLLKAKKYLGQHFLQDPSVAQKFVEALSFSNNYQTIIELGPGIGVLTRLLVQRDTHQLYLVEIDPELVAYLKHTYPSIQNSILEADFLSLRLDELWHGPVAIIGNFPYNISSQLFFKLLGHRDQVQEIVSMVQKEVAERLTAKPDSKDYGIPSVLLQAFYDIEYLFTVSPAMSTPPPKVYSAVVRLQRNSTKQLPCDEAIFFKVVKAGFQQRRKKLKNALRHLRLSESILNSAMLGKRAEQLTVADFVALTQLI
ncbi:MAG: 16S rRNA (adenine(1518)-N(6)/adenine(1519)-N(6))-dimethyltransferase RsmA [Bacteroidota bacterium]